MAFENLKSARVVEMSGEMGEWGDGVEVFGVYGWEEWVWKDGRNADRMQYFGRLK